jgi:hypothetical protein
VTPRLHRRTEGAVHLISIVRRSQKLVDWQEGVTDSRAGQRGSNLLAVIPERISPTIFS